MKHMQHAARAAAGIAFACAAVFAHADGMPNAVPAPERATQHHLGQPHAVVKRDPLDPDTSVAVKDEPVKAVDLPGVMKLDGADRDLVDAKRVRRISWSNAGTQAVWVSDTQPNLIQLPFVNPQIVSTNEIEVQKRATSNNVYVFFGKGVDHPVQMWLEPQAGSSAAIGLQLVPKHIPAQTIVVVDDTPAGMLGSHPAPEADTYVAHVQALLQGAALGDSPAGYSVVALQVPPMVVDGLAVQGLRRLSGREEDIYVYTVANPGKADVQVREQEFDGPDVEAVSVVPKPLLHAGESTLVAVLAKKHTAKE
jgi:conjugal transfer pilus assembly protein TraK